MSSNSEEFETSIELAQEVSEGSTHEVHLEPTHLPQQRQRNESQLHEEELLLLMNQISEVKKEKDQVELETYCFEKFLSSQLSGISLEEEQPSSENRKIQRNIQKIQRNTPLERLTGKQKYDIGNTVQDSLTAEVKQQREGLENVTDTLRAVLEETELRIYDLKQDAYEFKRGIVVGGVSARTGIIASEKVLKYYENREKQKDIKIEKLRLKNNTMRHALSKVETQLGRVDSAGDTLHYIDFHQLQIENKQFVRKLEEKKSELAFFKSSTAVGLRNLNSCKGALDDAQAELDAFEKACVDKREMMSTLSKECASISRFIRKCSRINKELQGVIKAAGDPPPVAAYILQKKQMYEAENNLFVWNHRVGISKQALVNSRHKKRAALKEIKQNRLPSRAVTR